MPHIIAPDLSHDNNYQLEESLYSDLFLFHLIIQLRKESKTWLHLIHFHKYLVSHLSWSQILLFHDFYHKTGCMLPRWSLTWSWLMVCSDRNIFIARKLQVIKARSAFHHQSFLLWLLFTDWWKIYPTEGFQPIEAFSSMWLSQFLNLAPGLGVLKSNCSIMLHQQVLHQHQAGSRCLPEVLRSHAYNLKDTEIAISSQYLR